ncbi:MULTISPECIES: YihY/virulence factor BrkB family protein [unclassified Sporosarcina]|uniref:YihY/virulence factor BrkB family protein n=1 Tax=unclassified Sporosarcina TaxID=2647733 RepID=UPI00203EFF28|nr:MULTISPECIES: YihY/virulence factor BrkB family protein [unclassified Sporosarcina]GKV65074.1 putative ribonuclease-like protein YfkH [Sporosarcina sp. NCCP-2331]GLB56885.1 putative ribonuclease-like protein YfkH [Sporosarcina sp. NCCP-2378]
MDHHKAAPSSDSEEVSKTEKVKDFIKDVKDGNEEDFNPATTSGFIKQLIIRLKELDVSATGSQLAFFFLLSLFPLLIFLFTLLPYLNLDQSQIFLFIREYAPESTAALIEGTLSEVLDNRSGGLLSVGILATIWSASKGMSAVTKGLNHAYEVEDDRNFFVSKGLSIGFTIMLIATVIVALVLPIFGQPIGKFFFSFLGLEESFLTVWTYIRFIIPPVMIFAVFSLLYWLVPDIKLRYKSIIPGSIFATIGWILTSLAFSFYISNFGSYANTYGSIAGIIVLIMWLYLSAIILLIGGIINSVMQERYKKKQQTVI